MADFSRRIERLERFIAAAQPQRGIGLISVILVGAKDGKPIPGHEIASAKSGERIFDRRKGETADEFKSRVESACFPPAGQVGIVHFEQSRAHTVAVGNN